MNSQVVNMSLVEFRSQAARVVEERQRPIREKQAKLLNPDFPDHSVGASELVRKAAETGDQSHLLEAAKMLQQDDAAITARQLGASAAEYLTPQIEALDRLLGGFQGLDYSLASLYEQCRKRQVSAVGHGAGSNFIDASIDRHIKANHGAIETSIGLIRDSFKDERVTRAAEQLAADLREYVDAVFAVEAL